MILLSGAERRTHFYSVPPSLGFSNTEHFLFIADPLA